MALQCVGNATQNNLIHINGNILENFKNNIFTMLNLSKHIHFFNLDILNLVCL